MNPQVPNPRFTPIRRVPTPGRDFTVPQRPPTAHLGGAPRGNQDPKHQAHRTGLDTLARNAPPQTPAIEPTPAPHTFTPHPPSPPTEHFRPPEPAVTPEPVQKDPHHKDYKNYVHKFLKGSGWIASFALLVGMSAIAINAFLFQSYYVAGSSMQPTLSNNDRLIIDKTGRSTARLSGKPYIPERGQIIVLGSEMSYSSNPQQLIKRVIGIPGDVVTIKDGKVTITNTEHPNGFDIDKDLGLALEPTFDGDVDSRIEVPDGHVFVLGDNRGLGGSYDSRMFGTISSDKIEGRLLARILPFGKTGIF